MVLSSLRKKNVSTFQYAENYSGDLYTCPDHNSVAPHSLKLENAPTMVPGAANI